MTGRRPGWRTNRCAVAALVASLAAGAVAVGTSRSEPAEAAAPLRIMPLGDSMTVGYDGDLRPGPGGGYRYRLEDLLVGRGQAFDFVGMYTNGTSALADQHHEGVNGETTTQIRDRAAGRVASYAPDVVLLMAGTNDIVKGVAVPTALDGMRQLLATVRAAAPAARIVVGTIPPVKDFYAGWSDEVAAYNAGLDEALATITGPTQLVNTNAAVGLAGIGSDGLHPVAAGFDRMADTWLGAIPTEPPPPTTVPGGSTTTTVASFPPGAAFLALRPARLLDTRPAGATVDGLQQREGIRAAGTVTQLQVAGRGGVPADATAAVLNLTATVTGGAGFATMWPCDQPEPNASNLNYTDHDVANAVIAKLDATGKVCIRNSATTHLIADVNGAIPAGGAFTSLTPARLLDTRPAGTTVDGLQQRDGIRAAGTVTQLQVAGRGGVPADATAAVLNLTATVTGGAGFATMWPCDQPEPNASNLNYTDHDVANAVIAKLDATGKVCIRNSATTHLIADVNGAIPAGGAFTSLTPARLLDTRPAGTTVDGLQQRDGIRAAGTVTQLQVAGRGGVPADATAAVLNLTATVTGGAGFATMWPCDQPEPNASNLNYTDHDVANAVIAKLDATGKVCIRNSATTHLIADVNGWTT